jgi:polyphosphate kinase 2 (PPK2 family)
MSHHHPTFIIMHHHDYAGKDGKVLSIYDDLANAQVHPDKALEVLVKK